MSLTRTYLDLADALRTLVEHWDDLHDARLIGTRRPWTEPTVTPEQRARMDARAREELHDLSVDRLGNVIAVGYSPAPAYVEVLDLLAEITLFADALAGQTAEVLRSTGQHIADPPPASSAYDDPRSHLRFVLDWLADIAADSPAMVESWADTAVDLERETNRALRLIRDGQVLKAVCPWCHGAGQREPRHTLRIREAKGIGAVVMCTNPGCTPPESDCGIWIRHQPAWAQEDWPWLVGRIMRDETQRVAEEARP